MLTFNGCFLTLQVYLADYGLSYRYCPYGVHKEYKEDPKKRHNGTTEYTSIDAHNGVGKVNTLFFLLEMKHNVKHGDVCIQTAVWWSNIFRNPLQLQLNVTFK